LLNKKTFYFNKLLDCIAAYWCTQNHSATPGTELWRSKRTDRNRSGEYRERISFVV